MRIYLAGKIGRDDWRHDLVPRLSDEIRSYGEWKSATSAEMTTGDEYSGPFFIGCSHGCQHGSCSHGAIGCCAGEVSRLDVAAKSSLGIENCDLLIAWAGDDFATAYGTLVEIGVAAAMGKAIVIIHKASRPYGLRSIPTALRDQWFAFAHADMVLEAENPVNGITSFLDWMHLFRFKHGDIKKFLRRIHGMYANRLERAVALKEELDARQAADSAAQQKEVASLSQTSVETELELTF